MLLGVTQRLNIPDRGIGMHAARDPADDPTARVHSAVFGNGPDVVNQLICVYEKRHLLWQQLQRPGTWKVLEKTYRRLNAHTRRSILGQPSEITQYNSESPELAKKPFTLLIRPFGFSSWRVRRLKTQCKGIKREINQEITGKKAEEKLGTTCVPRCEPRTRADVT